MIDYILQTIQIAASKTSLYLPVLVLVFAVTISTKLLTFSPATISPAMSSQPVRSKKSPLSASKSGSSNTTSSATSSSPGKKCLKELDAFDDDPRAFVGRYRNLLLLKFKLQQQHNYKVNSLEEKTIQVTLASLYSAGELAVKKKKSFVKSKPSAQLPTQCNVCFVDFDEEARPVQLRVCGHSTICTSCFHTYLSGLIKDDLILPCLRCPHPDCHEILSHLDIVEKGKLSASELVQLVTSHMSKLLPRHPEWLPCGTMPIKEQDTDTDTATGTGTQLITANSNTHMKHKQLVPAKAVKEEEEKTNDEIMQSPIASRTRSRTSNEWTVQSPTTVQQHQHEHSSSLAREEKTPDESTAHTASVVAVSTPPQSSKCHFGFLVDVTSREKKIRRCEYCHLAQEVRYFDPEELQLDDETRKLVEDGVLRPCPSCKAYNMKDYGICNVIQCHTCQIWWNWTTRQMGKSQNELKNKARMDGSLWGAGELAYQQKLQRENLPEFVALLKRNGIDYDPNYIRGS